MSNERNEYQGPGDSGSREGQPEEGEASEAPATQSEGALVPPPVHPPTAVGAAAESPPPRRGRPEDAWRARSGLHGLGDVVNAVLDLADDLGDAIASRLRLHRSQQ